MVLELSGYHLTYSPQPEEVSGITTPFSKSGNWCTGGEADRLGHAAREQRGCDVNPGTEVPSPCFHLPWCVPTAQPPVAIVSASHYHRHHRPCSESPLRPRQAVPAGRQPCASGVWFSLLPSACLATLNLSVPKLSLLSDKNNDA